MHLGIRQMCPSSNDRKTPITAADLLNDRVIPLFENHDAKLMRMLTDRGSEFCGNPERHEYELYLAVEDIDHTRTRAKSPPAATCTSKRFNRPGSSVRPPSAAASS